MWSTSCPSRYSLGEEPRYPLDRRLGEPQSGSGCFGNGLLSLRGFELQTVKLMASHYTNYAFLAGYHFKKCCQKNSNEFYYLLGSKEERSTHILEKCAYPSIHTAR
jgi:hypothetical protein